MSGGIGLFAARFIDLTELGESLVSVELELINPEVLLGRETSDGGLNDKFNLVTEGISFKDGGCV